MPRSIGDLSHRLLRRGAGRLADHGDACSVCHRTPLVGERVARYADGSLACTLCTNRKKGEVERVELVHHSEWGHAVKPLTRPPIAV